MQSWYNTEGTIHADDIADSHVLLQPRLVMLLRGNHTHLQRQRLSSVIGMLSLCVGVLRVWSACGACVGCVVRVSA